GNKALTASLSAITAAVVGVILNLAIWFAIHTVFSEAQPVRASLFAFDAPKLSSVDPWALLLSVGAAVAIFRFNVWPAQENPEKARHEGGPFGERTAQRAGHHRVECSRMAECRHEPYELNDAD